MMKAVRINRAVQKLTENTIEGRNIISTISRSNNKKIKVRKKYRKEKGTRDKLWCSNPHSQDDISSRFKPTFSEIRQDTNFRVRIRLREINSIIMIINILN